MRQLLPKEWPQPRGYSNGILADGPTVYVAGMIGWNADGEFADSFVAQLEQALTNIVAVLDEGGARPENIVRMNWYVKGMDDYRDNLAEIGAVYRRIIGKNFPVMAVIGVSDLVERDAMIEIDATAVLPR